MVKQRRGATEDTIFVLLTIVLSGTNGTSAAEPVITTELKAIAASGKVPAGLVITYSDMHGLWGGETITIRGNGRAERIQKARGNADTVKDAEIPTARLLQLIKLLIDLKAWEQQTPERTPIPDESRATLTISVNQQTSRLWEWFNEMPRNKRLSVIRQHMVELTTPK